MTSLISAVLCVILGITFISALPSGAPSTGCVSMYPQHPGPNGPVSAQAGLTVPFQIMVAPASGTGSGFRITVVRNPNFPGAPQLLGFFLQVREPGVQSEMPLGEFVQLPPFARFGDCGAPPNPTAPNTITHLNNFPKPIDGEGLVFFWNPTNIPASVKQAQVLGTFVQNLQTFWVKVPSQIFDINNDVPAPTPAVNVPVMVPNAPPSTPDAAMINHNVNANDANTINVNNDRRPGFGNTAAENPVINSVPQTGSRPVIGPAGSSGCQTIFAGLLPLIGASLLLLL